MDTALLRTFLAVDEAGSFSAAAQRLHCVQSNVTARIRRLEQHFGQAVFLRGKGGARLTAFGETLKTKATALLHEIESTERELLEAAGTAAPLVLGSMESTAAVRLPSALKALRSRLPKANVTLQTGPTAELLANVWDRKIDAAFVAGPVDPDRFHAQPAFPERLVHISSRIYRQTEPLLAFRSGCSYRAVAQSWLRANGKMDTEVLEMGTLEGILGCVATGMGFAVAPESAAEQYRDRDELLVTPLPAPFDTTTTHLVWRIDHEPAQVLRELLDIIRDGQARTGNS